MHRVWLVVNLFLFLLAINQGARDGNSDICWFWYFWTISDEVTIMMRVGTELTSASFYGIIVPIHHAIHFIPTNFVLIAGHFWLCYRQSIPLCPRHSNVNQKGGRCVSDPVSAEDQTGFTGKSTCCTSFSRCNYQFYICIPTLQYIAM